MMSKMLLCLVTAAQLSLGGGCKKDEAATTETPPPAPPADTGAAAPAQPATGDEVATYPDMTPERGTKKTLQTFYVYQAADPNSKRLTTLGANTFIDLKGRRGNWMLIDWPCGVAKLCPGWIELRVNDTRVTEAEKPDAGNTTPDAGADAGPDAGNKPDGGNTPDGGGDKLDAGADSGPKPDSGRPRIPTNFPRRDQ